MNLYRKNTDINGGASTYRKTKRSSTKKAKRISGDPKAPVSPQELIREIERFLDELPVGGDVVSSAEDLPRAPEAKRAVPSLPGVGVLLCALSALLVTLSLFLLLFH